jgi:hypothetical protein
MRRIVAKNATADALSETCPMFTAHASDQPRNPGAGPGHWSKACANAWGGGEARWLDPGVAAEFDLGGDAGKPLGGLGRPAGAARRHGGARSEGRKKRLLIADMDSTMIQQECIDELADEAGVGAHVADITARAMNGELDFEAALRERVGLLKGSAGSGDRAGPPRPDHLDAGGAALWRR